ncbi:MAG: EcoAI/FtnUII family type I restriction enzme subunit R [Dehalococcoidia bacterium]
MPTEADTCRTYVLPALYRAGWTDDHIREQASFTDGRIIVAGGKIRRGKRKRVDYLLSYRRDLPLAVVEAKPEYKLPGDGLQQAKTYGEILDLKFVYSTNGLGIVEFDYTTGVESELPAFPAPEDLWRRHCTARSINPDSPQLLAPYHLEAGQPPRYYQDISIHRATEAILGGKRRVLLTLATGTGKTVVAFQLCWRLWSTMWNLSGEYRKPRILYLADRNVLVDDPKDKTFAPFGDARWKIEGGKISKGREMYFSTYQAIAHDEARPGLYREFPRDFFDLVIVDECHRGSARETSNWREILEYFRPAVQVGMTATPLREDNRDTYRYFCNPLYTYSLRNGIDDGFLAPYRVHRVVTSVDATGWRLSKGDLDRYGREIPDQEYGTRDFEKAVALRSRTKTIARHLADFMERTDPFAKTIVFCVDQEHAEEMRRELNNLNAARVRQYPDYVARVTSDEGDIGRGYLSKFQELETTTPVILTTSQLLTTGVDAPMCKNVVLARVIGSMTEFKQIIGRGTRVREDYGKIFFHIVDYTGSATRLFADPDFDGEPALIDEELIDEDGAVIEQTIVEDETPLDGLEGMELVLFDAVDDRDNRPRKLYYDGGRFQIAAEVVYELDADGKQLRVVSYADYARDKVQALYRSTEDLEAGWRDGAQRRTIIEALEERGIDLAKLGDVAGVPDADPLDLLCHLAFNGPLRTRRERAERLKRGHQDFFDRYGPEARTILDELLEKYAEQGIEQLRLPDALKLPPISTRGNPSEIARAFGGADQLRKAVDELQELLYAA